MGASWSGRAALAVALVGGLATPAGAAPVRFGFTAPHAVPAGGVDDEEAWSAEVVALVGVLGPDVVRTGGAAPLVARFGEVSGAPGDPRSWEALDARVATWTGTGATICLTLAEPPGAEGVEAWAAWVEALAERYDGDAVFLGDGADLNAEHPDINGSGLVTDDDWDADEADKLAWAGAHRVHELEIGHRPRQLELTGGLAPGAYGTHLVEAASRVRSVAPAVLVVLAGTDVEAQAKSDFVARLDALEPSLGPWFDAASADVASGATALAQIDAATSIAKLGDWTASVDHPETERWAGAVAVSSGCEDPRCSPRTQAGSLVRQVTRAIAGGVSTVAYEGLFGWEGTAATALLHGDGAVAADALVPTGAWAVWRELEQHLGGLEPADVTLLSGLPSHATGARVGERGWLLWRDWFTAAEGSWDGELVAAPLEGLDAPSVAVRALWPETLGATLGPDGTHEATWTVSLVAVEEGRAMIPLGEDPVWVTTSDVELEGEGDDEPGDGSSGGDAPPGDGDAPGGCAARGVPSRALGGGWLLLALALAGAARRGRRET